MKPSILRQWLLAGCALTALAPVSDKAAEPSDTQAVEDIVVTGQRVANEREISAKHDAAGVLDGVAANEIGQLPDFNVADALKRVAGVNVLLYQGEPRFVTIRGFDANYDTVTIDGFTFATPDSGGRQVYMEVLPSDLAQRMDVYKTGAPDLDGHAVGGVVNLVTPSAFDFPDMTLVASAKGGYNLQKSTVGGSTPAGEGSVRASGLFGPDNQFGLLVAASFWERDIHVPQEETAAAEDWFTPNGSMATKAYGGNGIAVPAGRLWYNYQDDRRRAGVSERLDWQPTEQLKAHVSAFYYYQREVAARNDLNASVNSTSTDTNQTANSGTLSSVNQYAQLANLNFTRKLWGTNGDGEYSFADGYKLDFGAAWSKADLDNPQIFDKFTQKNLGFDYDTSGTSPIFTPVNAALANNLALYQFTDRQVQAYSLEENVYNVQANLSHNVDRQDRGLGFKLGAKWVETLQGNSLAQATYNGPAPYTLANVSAGQYLCGLACNDGAIPLVNEDLANSAFSQNFATLNKTYQGSATAKSDLLSELGGDYSVREDIYAGYGLLAFAADDWRVQGGLRVEYTDFNSAGFLTANNLVTPSAANKDYTDLLPSITGSLDTTEDSLLRLAYSRTLGRPRYSDEATHGGVLTTSATPYTLAQGNANLSPRLSDNFDIAEELYTDHGRGLVSLGGFYKIIHHEIFTFGQMETLAVNGGQAPVLVTQAQNSPYNATVKGLEFNLVHDFDFLPAPFSGFGISANGMLSQTSFPIVLGDGTLVNMHELPEQANRIFNVALYYEGESLHGRIAWNHTGKMWDDRYSNLAGAATYYENRDFLPSDHLDLQMSYDLRKSLSVDFSAQNITGAGVQENDGKALELGRQWIGFAPTLLFGVSARL
jgi:TonB-dependent receptor